MKILNRFLGVISIIFVLVLSTTSVLAQEGEQTDKAKKTIVVISDRVEQANAQYLIYPQVSEMVAAEVINELNKEGAVTSVPLSTVREKLRSQNLIRTANKLLGEYRYTYELNYEALKRIAKEFNTTNVLLVTGALDTVSDFLKPTWWNFLNVPGENVVKTEYRLYTYIVLVDLNTQTITWQNTYHKQITSPEFALANATYSPDYRQLTKIKKSTIAIAKDAAYRVESVLVPWFTVDKTPPTLHEKVKFNVNKKYDEYIQNINARRAEKEQIEQAKEMDAVLKSPKKETTDVSKVQWTKEASEATTNKTGDIKESKETVKINNVSKEGSATNNVEIYAPEKQIQTKEITVEQELIEEPKDIQVSPLNIIIPKM